MTRAVVRPRCGAAGPPDLDGLGTGLLGCGSGGELTARAGGQLADAGVAVNGDMRDHRAGSLLEPALMGTGVAGSGAQSRPVFDADRHTPILGYP